MALFTVKKKLSFEDDIINNCLLRGSCFVNGKKRIVELFNNSELSSKQRAKLICNEYGVGGWSYPLSGDGIHGADHDSKGLKISYPADVNENRRHIHVVRRGSKKSHRGNTVAKIWIEENGEKKIEVAWSVMIDSPYLYRIECSCFVLETAIVGGGLTSGRKLS